MLPGEHGIETAESLHAIFQNGLRYCLLNSSMVPRYFSASPELQLGSLGKEDFSNLDWLQSGTGVLVGQKFQALETLHFLPNKKWLVSSLQKGKDKHMFL